MKLKKILLLFFFFLIILLFGKAFKESKLTDLDIIRINRRRSYYPRYLGEFYQNKLIERFSLSRKTFFSYLDW